MDTAQTVERLKKLLQHFEGRVRTQQDRKINAETTISAEWWAEQERLEQAECVDPLVHAIALLQNTEKDTELLNAAEAMTGGAWGMVGEITWGCGTEYKTCREALTAIAAQQEAESV